MFGCFIGTWNSRKSLYIHFQERKSAEAQLEKGNKIENFLDFPSVFSSKLSQLEVYGSDDLEIFNSFRPNKSILSEIFYYSSHVDGERERVRQNPC